MSNKRNDEFRGTRNLRRLQRISQNKQDAEIQRCLELGLEAAESINDRSIIAVQSRSPTRFRGD